MIIQNMDCIMHEIALFAASNYSATLQAAINEITTTTFSGWTTWSNATSI
jgi:hypothetical protein